MPSHALQWPEQMGRQGIGASRRGEPPASEIEQRNLNTMKMLQERWDNKKVEKVAAVSGMASPLFRIYKILWFILWFAPESDGTSDVDRTHCVDFDKAMGSVGAPSSMWRHDGKPYGLR